MKPHYDVALIPCTSQKNPEGKTPASLYKGGPFSLMMRHAMQRCDSVLIMSAKYGLLRLTDPVSYYDAYIGDLDKEERQALVKRIQAEPWVELYRGRILSYLPLAYWEVFKEAKPALAETCARPYRKLPMLTMYSVLSNEIKGYGTHPARR